jgi:hypothetical protein
MDQATYSDYTLGYDVANEPNSMAYNGSGGLGAMTSKESFARLTSSVGFLSWLFELKYGKDYAPWMRESSSR